MAVLTAKGIARVAIALLTRTLVLPRTVTMIPGDAFAGGNGDTVTIRVPQPGSAREQVTPGAAITYDDVDEVPVDLRVSHFYRAKRVTAQELTLSLEDYARQITRVQVEAIAKRSEGSVAAVINAMSTELTITADGSNIDEVVLEARELMGRAEVPMGDRFFAVSPEVATFVLSLEQFSRADAAGSTSALTDAIIGRYRGFTFVESPALGVGRAAAYHRSGIAFANFAPAAPSGAGAPSGETIAEQGIAMRRIVQWVPDLLSWGDVLSTFAGAAPVVDSTGATPASPRFIGITTAP